MSASAPSPCRIGVIGAGVIGRRHVAWFRQIEGCEIVGIADPSEEARAYAEAENLPWFPDYRSLLDRHPDGVVVAAPNQLHLSIGLDCIERRIPMLMEKPLAGTMAAAHELTAAAERSGVPVLVGHYRRHSPVVVEARRIIESGRLGRIAAISLRLVFTKPDGYFAPEWRRTEGGGPVLINVIHDIDQLRFLCGEIASVQAAYSSAIRGFPVEDTAAIILTFASGAIATVILSDTVASPYSWDLNAAEDPGFPIYGKDPYLIAGTHGSLALPSLGLWSYAGARGWTEPLRHEAFEAPEGDPYLRQTAHFVAVVRGEEAPLVTASDATRTLAVATAIARSAASGERVEVAA